MSEANLEDPVSRRKPGSMPLCAEGKLRKTRIPAKAGIRVTQPHVF